MNEETQEEAQQRLFTKEELTVKHDLPPEPETVPTAPPCRAASANVGAVRRPKNRVLQ